jgi:hypothetical protein
MLKLFRTFRSLTSLALVYSEPRSFAHYEEFGTFDVRSENSETLRDCQVMCQDLLALARYCLLQKFDMTDNSINDESFLRVAKGLFQALVSLTSLAFAQSQIGDEGAKAITSCLLNSPVRTVDLSDSRIGPSGAERLCECAIQQDLLENLSLASNQIEDDGLEHIARYLEKTKALRDLNIAGNRIAHFAPVCDALTKNASLKLLNVAANPVGDDDYAALQSVWSQSQTLDRIDVRVYDLKLEDFDVSTTETSEAPLLRFKEGSERSKHECDTTSTPPGNRGHAKGSAVARDGIFSPQQRAAARGRVGTLYGFERPVIHSKVSVCMELEGSGMDISAFIEHPKEFVIELAQVCDTPPDFGLGNALIEALSAGPDFVKSIPLVACPEDCQSFPPGTFIRFRAAFTAPLPCSEFVVLRTFHDGRYWTGLVPEPFPQLLPLSPPSLVSRRSIVVSTVATMTPWTVAEFARPVPAESHHLRISEDSDHPPGFLRVQSPLQSIVRFVFDLPDIPSIVYDFFGFFEEPKPFDTGLAQSDLGFYRALPSFLCFAAVPVDSLCPGMPITIGEIRAQLLRLLNMILDPVQAHLLLLWLVGRVRSTGLTNLAMGCMSLNFYQCDCQSAGKLAQLLTFLCTNVATIGFDCHGLNAKSYRPDIRHGNFSWTVLASASGTRILLDETRLEDGKLNDTGVRNFLLFQEVAFAQSYMMPIETEQFEIRVNFPFLIVSTSKSVIARKTAAVPTVCLPLVAVPIGGFRVGDFDIEPDIVPLLRCYVENVRNGNWQLESEAEEFVAQQIDDLTAADQDLRPADVSALLIINELNAVSMGLETITPESWQQSLDVFLGMVALQRANA